MLGKQFFLGLLVIRIFGDTVYRADFYALRLIIETHAFGALVRVDLIDLITGRDSIIGTFWLTHITVDAFIGNH
jgi:hypothetical protein